MIFLERQQQTHMDFIGLTLMNQNLKRFFELLEGTPDVYLVVKDNQGNKILTTKVMQTKKEIEYHIRIVDNIPNPNAIDIYSGNAQTYDKYVKTKLET